MAASAFSQDPAVSQEGAVSQDMQRVVSAAMDAVFYVQAYPDAGVEGESPLQHYLTTGWRDGRDPAPWFSTTAYLAAHGDVAASGAEPFYHYLTLGRREGRDIAPSDRGLAYLLQRRSSTGTAGWAFAPKPVERGRRRQYRTAEERAAERQTLQGAFEADYYLAANPDIALAGTDPLEHFLSTGWLEGRDPTARFSVDGYLESNPDVAESGMNPFVHYVRTGQAEGRKPRGGVDFRYDLLRRIEPMAARIAAAAAASAKIPPSSGAALKSALQITRSGLASLHLTFSHDDYTAHIGGMQLCLRREAAGVAADGRDHLHIHPATPWPVVRAGGEAALLSVVFNGERVGRFSPAVVAQVLADVGGGRRRSLAIHSMLGHAVDEVTAICAALGIGDGYFWLHDFASLCAGFHLMRDDVADCAAPPADSAACGVCVYGPWRGRHTDEHARLFAALSLTVVAPAQPTLDLWRRAGRLPNAGEIVRPHALLMEAGPARLPDRETPFRLAFSGLPQAHKGWPVFRELALRYQDDPRYAFLHLGSRPEGGLPVDFRRVEVREDQANAMQAALAAARADAALVWPLCRETFSFTAYEAVAAGVALITHPDSGNVAAFTQSGDHGLVLPDEDALFAAFESGSILELSRRTRRRSAYDLTFGRLSADLAGARA